LNITSVDLLRIRSEIVTILGQSFINSLEGKYNSIKSRNVPHNIEDIMFENAHPFLKWWLAFKRDYDISLNKNVLSLCGDSAKLLDLYYHIKLISSISNSERIIKSLKNRSTFHSGVYECYVASAYVNKGYKIIIPQEYGGDGKRTCDLIIIKGKEKIFIECKSLDDREKQRRADTLMRNILNLLIRHKKSWKVEIELNEELTNQKYQDITDIIRNDINKERKNICHRLGNYVKIECIELGNWDENNNGPIFFSSTFGAKLIRFHGDFKSDSNKNPIYKEFALVLLKLSFEDNIPKRIYNALKKARRQISENGPGIVHISLPYEEGLKTLKVIDLTYKEIFNKLNRDTRRINAVVITGKIVDISSNPPIRYNQYIIPNYRAKTNLPEYFEILGTDNYVIPIDKEALTIEIKYKVSPIYREGISSNILNHCSKDGKTQLHVWMTWQKKLRMEIINFYHIRKYIECDASDLLPNTTHVFIGTFGKNVLGIYIDGIKRAWKVFN